MPEAGSQDLAIHTSPRFKVQLIGLKRGAPVIAAHAGCVSPAVVRASV